MTKSPISRLWYFARHGLTPHFNQNSHNSIAICNNEHLWLQFHLQNQPFLAKNWLKWLKWLKMTKSPISWLWYFATHGLTPHFEENNDISIAICNNEHPRLQYHLQNSHFQQTGWKLRKFHNSAMAHHLFRIRTYLTHFADDLLRTLLQFTGILWTIKDSRK